MGATDIAVLVGSLVAITGLGWFFFAPRRARTAQLAGGVQRVEVTVRGGYSPDVIRVRQGVPLEMVFDRQESGECTIRVVFADCGVSAGAARLHDDHGAAAPGPRPARSGSPAG